MEHMDWGQIYVRELMINTDTDYLGTETEYVDLPAYVCSPPPGKPVVEITHWQSCLILFGPTWKLNGFGP